MPSASMARFAAVLGLIVVLVGALHWWRPFLTEQRAIIASTPSPGPRSVGVNVALKPRSRLCVGPVRIDHTTARAQFTLAASRPGLARLAVQARAPSYSFGTALDPTLQRTATALAIPITRPPHDVTGELCLRNAGRSRLLFVGTNDPLSIGLARTRVDDKELADQAVELELLQARQQSVLARFGTIVHRAADLTGNLMPFWLAWLLVVTLVIGTPLAIVAGFWATLRHDQTE
jgi:hypothetical protein